MLLDEFPCPGMRDSRADSTAATVHAVAHYHLELKQIAPHLNQLRILLQRNPFRVGELPVTRLSLERIECVVQASLSEITNGLQRLRAFELDGSWRVLAEDLEEQVVESISPYIVTDRYATAVQLPEHLSLFLTAIPSFSVSFYRARLDNGLVSLHRIRTFLSAEGFPPVVVDHVLNTFFELNQQDSAIPRYPLIAQILGLTLLKSRNVRARNGPQGYLPCRLTK